MDVRKSSFSPVLSAEANLDVKKAAEDSVTEKVEKMVLEKKLFSFPPPLLEKLHRARDLLLMMMKGSMALKRAGKSAYKTRKVLEVGGRLIKTKVFLEYLPLHGDVTLAQARGLLEIWKESCSKLSYVPWLAAYRQVWLESRTTEEFCPWLSQRLVGWDEEISCSELTTDSCDMNEEQIDSECSEHSFATDLQVKCNEEDWRDIAVKSKGLLPFVHPTREEMYFLAQKCADYRRSGSSLDECVWMAREIWKEENPGQQEDRFLERLYRLRYQYFIDHQKMSKELEKVSQAVEEWELKGSFLGKRGSSSSDDPGLPSKRSRPESSLSSVEEEGAFLEWKRKEQEKPFHRWAQSKISLPYEKWAAQQVAGPLGPGVFVTLDQEQRKPYQVLCEQGILTRNGRPISSSLEEEEELLFVIGPDLHLYCASYVRDMFEIPSFLGALMSYGGIQIDEQGQIKKIRTGMGHKGNFYLLEWLTKRGVSLENIVFQTPLLEGKNLSTNKYFAALSQSIAKRKEKHSSA